MESMFGSKCDVPFEPVSKLVIPSTVKLALELVAPLMRTDPMVFSLVVSRCVTLTPGIVTIRPKRSRPFSVILFNCALSISLEFSAEAVWIDAVDAVIVTCSVIAPSASDSFPRSRTSFAVTSISDLQVSLEAGRRANGQSVSRRNQAVEAEDPFRPGRGRNNSARRRIPEFHAGARNRGVARIGNCAQQCTGCRLAE